MKQTILKFLFLVTIILMDILGGAEIDLFVPSFPEIQTDFNLSPFLVEAILSINCIGYLISLLFVGALADRYGRKVIILIGFIIFIAGSILCISATVFKFLLIGRFLQGIGVAAPASLCFLIIADSYPLKKQQSLMAILNGIINIAIAAAPVAGSYITMYFHWQGNFKALLILAAFTLVMTIIFIPTTKLPEQKEPLSLKGYIPILKSKTLMLFIMTLVFLSVPYWVFLGMI
jgi:DHA1 family bicyclomycin/chloramphenicol resistance-like MFS transporter